VVTLATKQPSANIPGRPRSPPKAGFFAKPGSPATAAVGIKHGIDSGPAEPFAFDAFIETKEGEPRGG
jgi:hypothetical protein